MASPTQAGLIYLGGQFLFRSKDRGDSWERISPDLTTNDQSAQNQLKSGGLSRDNSSAENHTTIYTISESPKDAQVILGHAHASTTEQIYTHVDQAAVRDAITKLTASSAASETH